LSRALILFAALIAVTNVSAMPCVSTLAGLMDPRYDEFVDELVKIGDVGWDSFYQWEKDYGEFSIGEPELDLDNYPHLRNVGDYMIIDEDGRKDLVVRLEDGIGSPVIAYVDSISPEVAVELKLFMLENAP